MTAPPQGLSSWPAGVLATMNATWTQANAAGGAIVIEISPGTVGNEFIIMYGRAVNSGTNGLLLLAETATGGTSIVRFGDVASVASAVLNFSSGTSGTTTTALAANQDAGLGYWGFIGGTQALRIAQTGAGAQNDTLQILMVIRCRGAVPTVISTNSTNQGNVTVTAGVATFSVV